MANKKSTAPAASPSPGPRQKVHVQLTYAGKGPPGPVLHAKCVRIEETLVEENAGTIGETTAGGGTVDIYVVTREVQKTIQAAWKIVNHLGLSARTTIKIAAPKRAE